MDVDNYVYLDWQTSTKEISGQLSSCSIFVSFKKQINEKNRVQGRNQSKIRGIII
jgi:hypothetical protein